MIANGLFSEGEDVSPIETEDDVVAKAARVARYRKLDHKHVLHLTQESFTAETKKRDFLMVMFYLICECPPYYVHNVPVHL